MQRKEIEMFTKTHCLWILLIWTFVTTQYARSEVRAVTMDKTELKAGCSACMSTQIQIYGEITRADVAKVAGVVKKSVPKGPTQPYELYVLLDSSGGDVDAAMAIGRLIRTKTAFVSVGPSTLPIGNHDGRESAVCASACVLIFVAGSFRTVWGPAPIGIHRPYSTSPGSPTKDRRAEYTALARRVKTYLEEMAIPDQLYDAMMRVDPEDVRWLSTKEQNELGILGKDPAYGDSQDSRDAAARGISKQEWLQRKVLTHQFCDPLISQIDWHRIDASQKLTECIDHVQDTGRP